MTTEAISTGYYHSLGWNKDYLCIQILTITELLRSAEIKMPPQYGTFKQAQKVTHQNTTQTEMFELFE
jgi:site-specific DNA-methyltransferase (adenine-specific)